MLIALFLYCIFFSCNQLIRYSIHPEKRAPQETNEGLGGLVSSRPPIRHSPFYLFYLCALDQYGRNIVHHCALNNQPERIKFLLSLQFLYGSVPNFNQYDKNGCTPLHLAAAYGYAPVVKLLLEYTDVKVNAKNYFGSTPLHLAAAYGHVAVVKVLLADCRVDVNTVNNYGRSALYAAVINGHVAVVKVLLNHWRIHGNALGNDGKAISCCAFLNKKVFGIFQSSGCTT